MSPETLIALALALPSLGAVPIALSGRYPNLREGITLIVSCLLTGMVFALIPTVLAGERPSLDLIDIMPGIPLRFTVEPLGMLFAAVASLLWPINSLYSIGYMRANQEIHQTRFYTCFALAIASTMGVALAGNLLTLFIFYEAISLSTYPLVTHKGTPDAIQAGRVYLGILLSTSIGLFLLAILWTWYSTGTLEFRPGGILTGHVHGPQLGILLFLYIFGIGKAALMPVHRWLPAAMVAPTPVSALLHAVAVVKGGVFAVIKVIVYVFGLELLNAEAGSTYWLLYVAGFTLIVASVIALRQDNLKLRLAYSTISQLAYVVLGAALFAPPALMGAALHIAAHAFGKITLFFAAGSIYTAAHKTEISQLNGIGRRMPWTMGAFAIGSLSMIGLPLVAGFISKWYLLEGAFQAQRWPAVGIIMVSTLLNAAYFIPIVYVAFFKPEDDRSPGHGEAPWPVVVALVVTAALTVLLFLFPGIALALATQVVRIG
ncbi:MAG: monovalent cation/H+ antiporter subunit D family protein [Candidatus Competibacteraceae bacterium]